MNDFFVSFWNALSSIFGENRLGRTLQLVFLIVVVLVGIGLWDSLTGDFTLRQTEKKIVLLSELYELEQKGITNSPTLQPIYRKFADELKGYKPQFLSIPIEAVTPNSWQFIGGLILWILIGTVIIRGSTGDKGTTFLAVILVGIIGGILGSIIPDTSETLLNIIIGFGVQFPILLLLGIYGSRANRK